MSVGAVNKQTGERIPTAGIPAVDSVLSGTSTNPVQNRVVKEALDGKQDTLTFDNTPTKNSNNPVKSNGIYDSEKDIYAAMGEMGAKNFNSYPYYNTTKTVNGITFTDNGDGAITVDTDGSASTGIATFFCQYPNVLSSLIKLNKDEAYIFSDTTHSGIANNCVVGIRYFAEGVVPSTSTGTAESCKASNNWQVIVTNAVYAYIYVYVWSNETVSNLTFKPMLRLASDTDDTYQPYAKTNKQLTDDIALLNSEKADTDMVAADFNAGTSYTAGNYCVQDGKLYKFKNNHSGAWSSADVDEVKITGELSALKSGLTKHAITFTANTGYTIEDKGSYVIGNVAYLNFYIKSSSRITSSRVHVGTMSIELPLGRFFAVTCPSAQYVDRYLDGFANVIFGALGLSSIAVGDYVTQQDGCAQIYVNCSIIIG